MLPERLPMPAKLSLKTMDKNALSRMSKCRFIVPLMLGVLCPLKSHAQAHPEAPPRADLGLRVGLTAATYGGADADGEFIESKYLLGYGVGVFVELPLTRWLSIQPEAAWSIKGASLDYTYDEPGSDRMGYLELYLAGWLTPFRFKAASPYLSLGPGLGFLLSCESYNPRTGTEDCKDARTLLDVSVMIGLGTTIELAGPSSLLVEARYEVGISSFADTGADLDVKNRALLFSIGYSHRLGGADRH
jgi:Outer membrane protein beta-barrel domain